MAVPPVWRVQDVVARVRGPQLHVPPLPTAEPPASGREAAVPIQPTPVLVRATLLDLGDRLVPLPPVSTPTR